MQKLLTTLLESKVWKKLALTLLNTEGAQIINNAMLMTMHYLYQHPTFRPLGVFFCEVLVRALIASEFIGITTFR